MTTTADRQPERIVVGIDGSPSSRAAVRWAIAHARPDDTIVLVHAWEPSPAMVDAGLVDRRDDSAARGLAHHELARAQALPRDDHITLSCDVVHGDARDCLSHEQAALLIVGARGRGGLASVLLGSVSAHLAHHCSVPLVIVPGPGNAARPQAPR